MGDSHPQGGRTPLGNIPSNTSSHARRPEDDDFRTSANLVSAHAPYEFHLQAPTPQERPGIGQSSNAPGQRTSVNTMAAGPQTGILNMGVMAGALPDLQSPDYQQSTNPYAQPSTPQRFPAGPSPSAVLYQLQQNPPFAGQTNMQSSGYNLPFQSQYAPHFPHAQQGSHSAHQQQQQQQQYQLAQGGQHTQSGNPSPVHQSYPSPGYFPSQQQQQQYMYYPTPYGQPGQSQQGFQGRSSGAFVGSYNRRGSQSYGHAPFQQHESGIHTGSVNFPAQSGYVSGAGVPYGYSVGGSFLQPGSGSAAVSRNSSGSSLGAIPSVPRGPPRKPKQSGHALWVGNLPPGTVVTDLKDHFSKDATNDIESVFLISKSNCAFVNYRSDAACAAAMTRFHDSRFQGVRLVCRLRRSSAAPSPGVPTGPAALTSIFGQTPTHPEASVQDPEHVSGSGESDAAETSLAGESASKGGDMFFIVKSLTVEDLELSARNGIWATQAHNEAALNKAYENAENVYLIFSANKSGEYFGYARMVSPISDDAAANLDWAPKTETIPDDPELPRSIPTAATEFAPKGRIIDDSARGTIFWEADPKDQDIVSDPAEGEDNASAVEKEEGPPTDEGGAAPSGSQSFGKPFRIEWMSTTRVPFYRTRGLRNPWNANREVKIARDGTELETNVGKRLIQMFHRSVPAPGDPGMGPGMAYPGAQGPF